MFVLLFSGNSSHCYVVSKVIKAGATFTAHGIFFTEVYMKYHKSRCCVSCNSLFGLSNYVSGIQCIIGLFSRIEVTIWID